MMKQSNGILAACGLLALACFSSKAFATVSYGRITAVQQVDTELLLQAETDDEFDRAERRMRLVCG